MCTHYHYLLSLLINVSSEIAAFDSIMATNMWVKLDHTSSFNIFMLRLLLSVYKTVVSILELYLTCIQSITPTQILDIILLFQQINKGALSHLLFLPKIGALSNCGPWSLHFWKVRIESRPASNTVIRSHPSWWHRRRYLHFCSLFFCNKMHTENSSKTERNRHWEGPSTYDEFLLEWEGSWTLGWKL